MMISKEKRIGRQTSRAAVATASRASTSSPLCSRSDSACMIRSTMTIVPSTMIPKSSAPMLRRLSDTPLAYMHTSAKSSERGMMSAVSSAARTLSRKTSSTVITMTKPATRTCDTVRRVLWTRSERS